MPARSHLTFANGILMVRYMIMADRVPGVDPGQPELYDVADELIRQGVISDLAGRRSRLPYHLSWCGLTAHGLNRQT
jgi:hypothetical protein